MLYQLHICPNNPEKYHFQWLLVGYSLVFRGYSFVLKQFLYGWKMRLNSCVASQMPILTSLYRVNTNKFHLQNLDNCPPDIVQFTSFFSQTILDKIYWSPSPFFNVAFPSKIMPQNVRNTCHNIEKGGWGYLHG